LGHAVTFQFVHGPVGKLQVLEEVPDREPAAVAVICHPHPLHGGALSNKVVHQLAKTFVELGAVGIRFNFRGVEQSEGHYDEGRGEVEDLIAMVEWATDRWPGLPLWLGGFSFGGFIAVKGAHAVDPDWLVTVAPAVNYFPEVELPFVDVPWLLVHGEADDVVPFEHVEEWLVTLDRQPKLAVLPDVGHFFHGRLNDLKQVIISAFETDS
jgi:alpha/beta superfamily hydrolase